MPQRFVMGLLVAALLVPAQAALAQDSTSGTTTVSGGSPIDEYVEDLPTAGGSVGGGSGGSGGSGKSDVPLSPQTQTNLEQDGGRDARILRRIATSPRYGAPPSGSGVNAQGSTSSEASAASAAESALTGEEGGARLAVLLGLMGAAALATGAVVVRRLRRQRRRDAADTSH